MERAHGARLLKGGIETIRFGERARIDVLKRVEIRALLVIRPDAFR
jgi:hypothetical protein